MKGSYLSFYEAWDRNRPKSSQRLEFYYLENDLIGIKRILKEKQFGTGEDVAFSYWYDYEEIDREKLPDILGKNSDEFMKRLCITLCAQVGIELKKTNP